MQTLDFGGLCSRGCIHQGPLVGRKSHGRAQPMTEFAYSLPQPWSYRKLGSKSVEYLTGRIVHQDYLYANVQLSDACGSTTISGQWPASMLLLHGLLDFVFVGLSLGEAREVTRECPTIMKKGGPVASFSACSYAC